MCGIVGYLGAQNPKDVILQGLKKLEYRGYDSAGVAILNDGHFKRVRAEGKLKNLEARLNEESFNGHLGIGHTRWATHGVPSERNAHPHQVNGVSLVHNGIIENYLEIREDLRKRGAVITSDTDSELVAHLVAEEVVKTQDLRQAVLNVLPQLRGAFSVLVVWEKQPDRLLAFKDGPPLILGVAEKQAFVVSDVQAALNQTRQFIYLDDREVAEVRAGGYEIFDLQGKPIQKPITTIDWNTEQSEKMGYSHYMLKEIYEQSRAVAAALAPHVIAGEDRVALSRVGLKGVTPQALEQLDQVQDVIETDAVFRDVERVAIVACGTSYYAGLYGKYLIERLAGLSCEVDVASEFRYRHPVLTPKTLVITVSQSGETADTLAAVRLAKQQGCRVLSICNVRNSTIDREAHGHLYMNTGTEVGVASTKAFTATLALFNLVALSMGRARGRVNEAEEKSHVAALLALPSQIEVVLAFDKYFMDAIEDFRTHKGFLYMGRGVSYPLALEGALKMKELAYLHAEGYAAGEMKHGPLALIDEKMAMVMIVPQDDLYEKTISNLEEAKARGGHIISIGTGDDERLKSVSHRYLALPKAHWATNAILAAVPLQLMAFHMAQALGHDVDQPRNLAKSVTVE
ncbi:MAG: glutamine--fructose-6-phosphate transaminase (isomerizing) [Bdellovibrionaceae bacterium]|nr:glutamine--fructose-6-phosphate transaminase (isomerizing) [Pseudobdellovibrionaceae bacterium]